MHVNSYCIDILNLTMRCLNADRTDLKEFLGGAGVECAVEDFGLFGEIVGRLNGSDHSLDGQKGSEVGCVGGDDDQSEKPPRTSGHSTSQRSTTVAQAQCKCNAVVSHTISRLYELHKSYNNT